MREYSCMKRAYGMAGLRTGIIRMLLQIWGKSGS